MILYVSFFTLFVMASKGDSTRSDRWRSVKKANHKIDLEHDFQGEIFFFFLFHRTVPIGRKKSAKHGVTQIASRSFSLGRSLKSH